jgi:PilZ domain
MNSDKIWPSSEPPQEKRNSARIKVSVPVELFTPESDVPHRCATTDLSETGCYIESIFPFPIGTVFEMSLRLDETLLVVGTVVTRDPQVGNGIKFTRMLPEDRELLRAYVEAAQQAEGEPRDETKDETKDET